MRQTYSSKRLIDNVIYKDGGLYWAHSGNRVGCINTEGYRVFGFMGKQYKEHREIFFIKKGYYPDQIDHRNGDKSDNRIGNLRDTNPNQNQYNRKDVLGYRFKNGKYEARISYEGKRIALGSFKCPTAARLAYLKAAKELYKEWYFKESQC